MAQWKKIIVSGSDAELNSLVFTSGNQQISSSVLDTFLSGSFSGSFYGDGSGLTGVTVPGTVSSSAQIDHDQTTNFSADEHFTQASITTVGTVTAGSVTAILPTGTVSGSIQVDHNATTNYSAAEHVDHTTVDITAGAGLLGGGDISATRTLSVNSGSMLPYYSGSIFGTVSGDITITAAGVASIAADSVALGTDTTGNYVASVAEGTGIDVTGTGEGAAVTVTLDLTEVIASDGDNRVLTSDGDGTLTGEANLTFNGSTLALTGNQTVSGNLQVGGNLTVDGDFTYLNVTNLSVDDKYILLASGSLNGDAGIIFNGTEGSNNSGNALYWDYSYNSNDGRLSIANGVSATETGDLTPAYSIAGVYEGSEANAATAQADHPGNIRIESGEIYIYV